jgi:hypothetical protein
MGGEHICTGCNALHGMPHKTDCVRLTDERWAAAGPDDVVSPLQPTAPGLSRVLVNDEDCLYDPLGHLKQRGVPEVDPLREARDQLKGALMQDPRNPHVAANLAACASAAALVSIAEDVHALVDHGLRDVVMEAAGDDSHLDGLKQAVRDLSHIAAERRG